MTEAAEPGGVNWTMRRPSTGATLSSSVQPRRLLDGDAGEFVAGGDAELAEGLAEVVGDGVGADVHAGGDLVVVQSLGDEAGDGLLGVGQAVPSGDGPGGGRAPVAAADAELAQPPPGAGLVAAGTDLAVSAECVVQVTDGTA